MKKYEVRFEFERLPKIVKLNTLEAAQNLYNKVKTTAAKNNKHGKVALWNNGWLERCEEF